MGETRNCFKFITTLTKLLGCFPVSQNGNKVTFEWYSLKIFCSFTSFLVCIIHIYLMMTEHVLGYVLMVQVVSGVAIEISFVIMAMNWSELAKECDVIDFHMKGYGFPKHLKLKLHIVCAMLVALCLVVCSLSDIRISRSPTFETHTFIGVWRAIIKGIKEDASFAAACKLLLMTVRQLSHWQMEMLRSCADIFIITVSMILSMRFRQIAERIDLLVQAKVRDENVWMRIREDYQRLCVFCEKWDNVLGYLVLSSFTSNIYSSLLHIQASLNVSETIDMVQTTSACIENLLVCMIICYTAGNVYEESRRFVRLLVLIPSDLFNDEIERMILQIRQEQPALTAKQLFTVKHSLILQILGGIATHEIILLQYYAP